MIFWYIMLIWPRVHVIVTNATFLNLCSLVQICPNQQNVIMQKWKSSYFDDDDDHIIFFRFFVSVIQLELKGKSDVTSAEDFSTIAPANSSSFQHSLAKSNTVYTHSVKESSNSNRTVRQTIKVERKEDELTGLSE